MKICTFYLHILLGIIVLLPCPLSAQNRLQWGDQGNGTYINPILNADYSDPDVIRVGEKYYMVASDFHFLGMQILESDDMVNWHLISQIYDKFDYPDWNENNQFGGGAWAPSIRYHDGKFWVFFCTYKEGLMMSYATDPHGPWSALHCLKNIEKWEDPCPFWDDDGTAYLGRSQWRAGPIIIHKMSPDGKQLLDDGVTVYTGPVAEGTKIYKHSGYYYLIIPEGGVESGWQTALRSKSIYGPYERKVVLEQGCTDINGPHQGALVNTPQGEWWFYHFQATTPCGRVVHLQPASWKDDWPIIGVDQDMNGVGEPVRVWTKPSVASPERPGIPQTDDEFDADAEVWVGQTKRKLGLQWQWNHNPHPAQWSMDRKGWLALNAMKARCLKESHNMLTQKTMGYKSEATTLVDVSCLTDSCCAGMLCTGKQFNAVGVIQSHGKKYLYWEKDGHKMVVKQLKSNKIYLKTLVGSKQNKHQFLYSLNGKKYEKIGESFSLEPGGWKGSRTGLYCYNTLNGSGKAYFDYFRYVIAE